MIELSTIRDLVAIFGVIAGFSYYVLTVRNNQRTQLIQMENRQTQLFMQFVDKVHDPSFLTFWVKALRWEWENYEDFEKKYGTHTKPEITAKRYTDWYWYNNIGLMLKNKLLNENELYNLSSTSFIMNWERWEPIIKEYRIRFLAVHTWKTMNTSQIK